MKIICFLKGIWRAMVYPGTLWHGYNFSGHDEVEVERHDNVAVFITKCEICGKVEVTWSK